MEKIKYDIERYAQPKTKATSERASLLEPFVERLTASSKRAGYKPMSKARICMLMAYIDTDDLHYFYQKLNNSQNFGGLWNWYVIAEDLNKKNMQLENKQRTSDQNKALHLYFTQLANELQNHGIDQQLFCEKLQGWSIPITPDFLKEVWKIKQKKMYGTDSTRFMESHQVDKVYEQVNHFTSLMFNVNQAFPSQESLDELYKNNVKDICK